MADLFAEVDEMMRQERLTKFWKENGNYIIAFVVGTILMTGILSGYNAWDQGVRENQTAALLNLQEAENYPENLIELDTLDLRGGLRGLAYLGGANRFMQDEKPEQAKTLYEKAAIDSGIPEDLRSLAAIMHARLIDPSNKEYAERALGNLKPIAGNTSSTWSAHAHIEIAVLLAHTQNNYAQAMAHLNAVLDQQSLPQSVYDRASKLHHLYALKGETQNNDE